MPTFAGLKELTVTPFFVYIPPVGLPPARLNVGSFVQEFFCGSESETFGLLLIVTTIGFEFTVEGDAQDRLLVKAQTTVSLFVNELYEKLEPLPLFCPLTFQLYVGEVPPLLIVGLKLMSSPSHAFVLLAVTVIEGVALGEILIILLIVLVSFPPALLTVS